MNCSATRLLHDRRGAAALEFAIVSLAFFPICFAIIELGLMLWTQNALQATANMTARCVAIASPACSGSPSGYAVTQAQTWLNAGILTSSGVTVATATTCSTAPGTMVKVTLTSSFLSGLPLPPPFNGISLSAVACYPTSP